MKNLITGTLRAGTDLIPIMEPKQEISHLTLRKGKTGILPGGREGRKAVNCSSRLFHHEIRAFPTLRLIWQTGMRPDLISCRGRYAV